MTDSAPAGNFSRPDKNKIRLRIPSRLPRSPYAQSVGLNIGSNGFCEYSNTSTVTDENMHGLHVGSHYEICEFSNGFIMTFGEICFDKSAVMSASFPDTLRIYVASSGDGEQVFTDGRSLSLKAPNSLIIVEPEGSPDSNLMSIGHTKYLCIFLRRRAMKQLYGGREDELPPALQAFVKNDLQTPIASSVPLTSSLLRCLEDVQSCQLRGQRRRLYMHSKAIEVVCQAIEGFEQDDSAQSTETANLKTSAVLKAQQLLSENFVAPPSLNDLAREVGMSRTALCTRFRQLLGKSVYDYIEELRMQQALKLLNDSNITVTEIAHAVGYNHSSSFAVAVRRRFGVTPSELRLARIN